MKKFRLKVISLILFALLIGQFGTNLAMQQVVKEVIVRNSYRACGVIIADLVNKLLENSQVMKEIVNKLSKLLMYSKEEDRQENLSASNVDFETIRRINPYEKIIKEIQREVLNRAEELATNKNSNDAENIEIADFSPIIQEINTLALNISDNDHSESNRFQAIDLPNQQVVDLPNNQKTECTTTKPRVSFEVQEAHQIWIIIMILWIKNIID